MGNFFTVKGPIYIGIIEDSEGYRFVLESTLKKDQGLEVIFSIGSIDGLLKEDRNLKKVNIILLDMKLGDHIAFDSLPAIRNLCPNSKVILVTAHFDFGVVNNSIRNKVEGYYLKGSSLDLIDMIKTVHKGFTVYDPLVNDKISEQMQTEDSAFAQFHLTNKEIQVVKLLSDGFSYKSISAKQQISLNTVRQHVRNIYRKVEVNSRYELIQKIQGFI
jgi:DNA-binding NarL/FixJ family response regulator